MIVCGRISTCSCCARSGSFAIRPDTERDDDRAGSRSQQHVVLGHRANARADNFQLHLIGRELRQHFAQHFHGTLHVGLDDDAQVP